MRSNTGREILLSWRASDNGLLPKPGGIRNSRRDAVLLSFLMASAFAVVGCSSYTDSCSGNRKCSIWIEDRDATDDGTDDPDAPDSLATDGTGDDDLGTADAQPDTALSDTIDSSPDVGVDEDAADDTDAALPDAAPDATADVGVCGPDPSGCSMDSCGSGATCVVDPMACRSTGCACEESSGSWLCTPDCGGGTCVAAADCPEASDPVCDQRGTTWRNACEAARAGATSVTLGACAAVCNVDEDCPFDIGRCGAGGCEACPPFDSSTCAPCSRGSVFESRNGCLSCTCIPMRECEEHADCDEGGRCIGFGGCTDLCLDGDPQCCAATYCENDAIMCPAIYLPVCGVDGRTYSNACLAGVAEVAVAYDGECGDACASNAECVDGLICYPPEQRCQPRCEINCLVPEFVCGSDGITYSCGAPSAHCNGARVAYDGPCDESAAP